MRLRVLSDLHLEFGSFRLPPADCDVVILAGDIHLGRDGARWAQEQFPGLPVIYVLGNHEFYRHALPDLTGALLRETEGSNIHVLERKALELQGWTILGCTLWTNFRLQDDQAASMEAAERMMSDYSLIQNSAEKRLLRAEDTAKLHRQSVIWLKDQLARCNPARTIVVTHHAPSQRSEAEFYANSPLAPAFASDLDWLIEPSGLPLWIHGHTHHNIDYQLGATRVLSNQHGYPGEVCARFDPKLVLEI